MFKKNKKVRAPKQAKKTFPKEIYVNAEVDTIDDYYYLTAEKDPASFVSSNTEIVVGVYTFVKTIKVKSVNTITVEDN